MNRDTLKGQWHQAKGEIKKQWGKLSDDDLDEIDGEWEKLIGKLQEAYGLDREEAERQAEAYQISQT